MDDIHDKVSIMDNFSLSGLRVGEEERARLERHSDLLERYRDLPSEEIMTDLVVLAQMAAFKTRQERLIVAARAHWQNGATHDCGEWKDRHGNCQVCGQRVF